MNYQDILAIHVGATLYQSRLHQQKKQAKQEAQEAWSNELKAPMFATMALEQQIDISFDIQPSLIKVKADPTHLRQILINLVNNAVKYNCKEGQIFLRFYKSNTGQNFVIEVQDTGIGITHDKIPKLFIEYFGLTYPVSIW